MLLTWIFDTGTVNTKLGVSPNFISKDLVSYVIKTFPDVLVQLGAGKFDSALQTIVKDTLNSADFRRNIFFVSLEKLPLLDFDLFLKFEAQAYDVWQKGGICLKLTTDQTFIRWTAN